MGFPSELLSIRNNLLDEDVDKYYHITCNVTFAIEPFNNLQYAVKP